MIFYIFILGLIIVISIGLSVITVYFEHRKEIRSTKLRSYEENYFDNNIYYLSKDKKY